MDFAARLFVSLDAMEVEVVARVAEAAERRRLTRVAEIATWLGNGWLYPIAALLAIAGGGVDAPLRFVAAAATSLAIAFTIYPLMKHNLARLRPCDYDPSLTRHSEPMDHYSCPSGHAMTSVAFGVSLSSAWPAAAPLVLAMCAIVAWSRVALGHHYVTDVLLGAALGALIAAPVASVIF